MTAISKPRYEFIDLMKGICIIMVVLYHSRVEFISNNALLTTFRMPLYFVLSGIFFKHYSSFREFFEKKSNSLIIPFITTVIVYNFIINIYRFLIHDYFNIELITPSMWFLLSLFQVGMMYYLISLLNNTLLETIICYALSFVGFLLYYYKTPLPMNFDSSLSCIIYYHIGCMLKKHNILSPQPLKYNYSFLLLSLSIFLAVGLLNPIDKLKLYINQYPSNFIVTQILAITGTMSVLFLSKIINKLPVISYLGKYSIIILCTHNIFLKIIGNTLAKYHIPYGNLITFVAIMILIFPTIYFIRKYLPSFYAQKPFFTTLKSSPIYKKYIVYSMK